LTRIIGVVSGKGGVGKTTFVSNLGAVLAQHFKKRVTVIDCNLTTSHLGLYLGMYYFPTTLNEVLRGESNIQDAVYEHFTGMKIIPASLSSSKLAGADVTQIKNNIESILNNNDIILLDSSPGLGREAIACLRSCDEVLYITTPYAPSVMDIVRCQEVANEVGAKPIGIVLNMVDKKGYEMAKEEIERLTRLPVLASIPYDKNVKKALAARLPVVVFKPHAAASKEFYRFATSLIGEAYREERIISRILNRLKSIR